MSRLIKSDASLDPARVRILSTAHAAAFDVAPKVSEAELERINLRQEIGLLRADLADKAAEIEGLRHDVDRASRDGLASGRDTGLKEAAQDFDRHLAVLSSGIGQAVDQFRSEIEALERLAPLLARQALEKVLGDPSNYAAILTATISHHLAHVDGAAIVGVEVSSLDFPRPEDLRGLTSALGRAKLEVIASDQLVAGACKIRLRLGVLEIGVDQQWPRLSELLELIARPEAP